MTDTAPATEPTSDDRRALLESAVDEMTRWPPQDRAGLFRRWHQGALSLVHLNVLAVLEAEGPLPMSRLAEALDVSDASATGIVDRLEKRGYIERRHGTEDRRVVLVHLTEAGVDVFRDAEGRRRERLRRVLGELTDEEVAGLLLGMRALHAARDRTLERTAADCPAEPSAPASPPEH